MLSNSDPQSSPDNLDTIRVLVIDDHPVVLEGLEKVFNEDNDIRIIGSAATARAALEKTAALHPHIVLLDIVLEGMEDGLGVAKKMAVQFPQVRVIVFTNDKSNANDMLPLMLQAGVRGYILKNKPLYEVVDAIKHVHQGHVWIDPTLSGEMIVGKHSTTETKEAMSEREVEVLQFLAQGLSNKEIGDELKISYTTVGTHLHHIYVKIGVATRTEAIVWAFKTGVASRP